MPPVKLSRIMYVPKSPKQSDLGSPGDVDLGGGQTIQVPNGTRHCPIDPDVLDRFLDAIDARHIAMEDALEVALTNYTNRLNGMTKPPIV